MDSETVKEAWDVCEVEELEQFNGARIGPAVFKPMCDGAFRFEERPCGDLWDAVKSMEDVVVLTEPLDGSLRATGYVYIDSMPHKVSIRTYSDWIKLAPGDTDCSFEAFKKLVTEFDSKVCSIEFAGGLEVLQ